jgi:acetyltransferase-like isoleucine patch superfamily enzyme
VAPEVLIGDGAHLWAYSPAPDGGPAIVLRRRADIRSYALLHCYGGRISVGVYSCINHFCFISGAGGVTIGDDVMLGTHTVILSSEHGLDRESATPMTRQPVALRPVVIEDNVYIGAHVTILGGVTIGTGAVVAAGAVVNRDVAPRTTVGGIPARLLHETPFGRDGVGR